MLCCLAFGIQGFRLGVVASLISEFILLLLRSSSCASYMSLFELFALSLLLLIANSSQRFSREIHMFVAIGMYSALLCVVALCVLL